MTGIQLGFSRHARRERMRELYWESGVFAGAGLWSYFSFAPLHLSGLPHGWAAIALWFGLGGANVVFILNRCLGRTWVDDEGLSMRSFFTRRQVRWTDIADIRIDGPGRGGSRTIRVVLRDGSLLTVPGAVARPSKLPDIAGADLITMAETLLDHWRQAIGQTPDSGSHHLPS